MKSMEHNDLLQSVPFFCSEFGPVYPGPFIPFAHTTLRFFCYELGPLLKTSTRRTLNLNLSPPPHV